MKIIQRYTWHIIPGIQFVIRGGGGVGLSVVLFDCTAAALHRTAQRSGREGGCVEEPQALDYRLFLSIVGL